MIVYTIEIFRPSALIERRYQWVASSRYAGAVGAGVACGDFEPHAATASMSNAITLRTLLSSAM